MNNPRLTKISTVRAAAIGLLACIGLGGFFYTSIASGRQKLQTVQTAPTPRPGPNRSSSPRKYSQFPHNVKAHGVDCGTCHKFPSPNWQTVRTGTDAFPDITDYPRHESCLSCHKQQFFKGATPTVCNICHTKPSPRNSSRHPFPNPREIFDLSPKGKKAESDFVVGFPHDKHIEIVSINSERRGSFVKASLVRDDRRRAGEESCSVCHQTYMPQGDSPEEYFTVPPPKLGDAFWLKKGTFKTAPIGHMTCFTCHSTDSGILPGPEGCASCHHLKSPQPKADLDEKIAAAMKIDDKRLLDSWRRRDSSGKFQHSFVAHVDMECSTCHNVLTINTADPLTKKVSISSCATCHATATSNDGGALNLEVDSRKANAAFQCLKCHITFGKLPIPDSHLAAITAAGN